jgi:hypothetical protein
MAEIRVTLENLLAWSGSTTNGELAYYRIQDRRRYAAAGATSSTHVYRDPTNDYGAGLVKSPGRRGPGFHDGAPAR